MATQEISFTDLIPSQNLFPTKNGLIWCALSRLAWDQSFPLMRLFELCSSMRSKTPVALFVYNRPVHCERTLTSLGRCDRLDECDVYIFCDAAKSQAQEASVLATKNVVYKWSSARKVRIIERKENLGVAHSIVAGVSDLVARYGRVVALEDDLVVSPDFINYMICSLDRYENCQSVYQVSGCTLGTITGLKEDAFFLPLTTTWGWATWMRAWLAFNWEPRDAFKRLEDPDERKWFDVDGSSQFIRMLEDRVNGRNDSWGILWWYSVAKVRGLVLYPKESLVWNGGFDSSGVHCGTNERFPQLPLSTFGRPRLPKRLRLPSEVRVDVEAFSQTKKFLRDEVNFRRSRSYNLIYNLQKIIKNYIK